MDKTQGYDTLLHLWIKDELSVRGCVKWSQ